MDVIKDYTNLHRWFLQHMLSLHVVSRDKIIQLFMKCMIDSRVGVVGFEKLSPEAKLKKIHEFIDVVNTALEQLNLKVSLVCCEALGTRDYVIHPIHETEVAKFAAFKCTPKPEREYLRVIVNAICESQLGFISEIFALNLTNKLVDCKISKRDANNIMKNLVTTKWLLNVRNHLFLDTRTFAEMKKYLLDQHGAAFTNCALCKEITLIGECCPSDCGIKIHRSCLEGYFSTGASKKCVGCKKSWPFDPAQPLPEALVPTRNARGGRPAAGAHSDEEMEDEP